MAETLKPCPFCGGEADLWAKPGSYGWFTVCQCSVCSASGKTFSLGQECDDNWENTKAAKRAVDAWNRRCPDAG